MSGELEQWKARAKVAAVFVEELGAVLAKIEALCDAADEGYGAGIYGTEVRTSEVRAILRGGQT